MLSPQPPQKSRLPPARAAPAHDNRPEAEPPALPARIRPFRTRQVCSNLREGPASRGHGLRGGPAPSLRGRRGGRQPPRHNAQHPLRPRRPGPGPAPASPAYPPPPPPPRACARPLPPARTAAGLSSAPAQPRHRPSPAGGGSGRRRSLAPPQEPGGRGAAVPKWLPERRGRAVVWGLMAAAAAAAAGRRRYLTGGGGETAGGGAACAERPRFCEGGLRRGGGESGAGVPWEE